MAEFKSAVMEKTTTKNNPKTGNDNLMEERIRRKIYNKFAFFFSLSTSSILKQNLRADECEILFQMTRHLNTFFLFKQNW